MPILITYKEHIYFANAEKGNPMSNQQRVIKFRAWDDHYWVGDDGSVRSHWTPKPRLLKLQKDHDGYQIVWLYSGGKRIIKAVHRLVLGTFIPKPSPKHQVNHKNGLRSDNRLENLEWVTSQENTLHGWKRGRKQSDKARKRASQQFSGTNNPKAKLDRDAVAQMRTLRGMGMCLKELSEFHGVSVAQVSAVCRGDFWNEKI